MEKMYEYTKDLHILFVGFKQAYDSIGQVTEINCGLHCEFHKFRNKILSEIYGPVYNVDFKGRKKDDSYKDFIKIQVYANSFIVRE